MVRQATDQKMDSGMSAVIFTSHLCQIHAGPICVFGHVDLACLFAGRSAAVSCERKDNGSTVRSAPPSGAKKPQSGGVVMRKQYMAILSIEGTTQLVLFPQMAMIMLLLRRDRRYWRTSQGLPQRAC